MHIKLKNNWFLISLFTLFLISISNNFYQIKLFDKYEGSKKAPNKHLMITGDINDFWNEANQIDKEIQEGKNYFETGGEYRRPYLPSRTFYLFSSFFKKNLITDSGKVFIGTEKVLILIFQSLFYYSMLFVLYRSILKKVPRLNSQIIILFLACEPTIFQYHSSFWSESIFFSLQIIILIYIFKNHYSISSLLLFGLILGIFYLQRSVAIFYILIVFIYFIIFIREKILRNLFLIFAGFMIVLAFIGFHNYKRAGVFYVTSTQAKDGFYVYLAPEILSKKYNINSNLALTNLQKKKLSWINENKLNIDKEIDRLRIYNYQQKVAFKTILDNPLISLKVIVNKTLHFFVIDPFTHVYYFHRWNTDNGDYYKSETQKKWISSRIIYSIFIYLFCFIGALNIYKKKEHKHILYYVLLSIVYFTGVQSWYGGTRYFAPILIYLSFLFSFGVTFLIKDYKKN
jgi:hypothetical protein